MRRVRMPEIPKSCNECIESDFKLPKPNCWLEKALILEDSLKYLKEIGIDIQIDVDSVMQKFQSEAKKCLQQAPMRAQQMLPMIMYEEMMKELEDLKKDNQEFRERMEEQEKNNGKTSIYKESQEVESPVREVKKAKKSCKPIGNWKTYQPNINEENIDKYLKKLGSVHADIKKEAEELIGREKKESDYIRVIRNKKGKFAIEYKEKINVD